MDVDVWVEKCSTCQMVKAEHQVPRGLLQNLLIRNRSMIMLQWTS